MPTKKRVRPTLVIPVSNKRAKISEGVKAYVKRAVNLTEEVK